MSNIIILINEIRKQLDEMDSNTRLDFLNEINRGYCRYCGDKNPKCQCWNDE